MYTHTGMYRHAYTHTDTCTYKQTHVHTDIHVHTHRHMYRYTHVHTHKDTNKQTHPYKKLQYFVVHSQSQVLHSRGAGREHSTHSFLCFHCAQLLSSLTAPSANDRSGLSSERAQQDGPGGHTRPHHNFHSSLASRRVEITWPGLEAPYI
ncbi:unnamed protein product, partial [Staurois parvus]